MTLSARYTELSQFADRSKGFEAIWVSVSDRAGSYRVLPDGRCDIILKFDATQRPIIAITVVLTGPTTGFYDIALQPGMGFVGVRLRPGFSEKILGFAPVGLVNANLTGGDALAALPALEALCAPVPDQDALAARLVAFVHQRSMSSCSGPVPLSQSVISAFHAAGGRLRVGEAAAMHGISERSVQRILLKATGLAPKAFAAILQFHRGLRLMRDHRLKPADAALEAGYSDQAHMNRAFRRLGGFSPARLPDVTLVSLSE